MSPSVQDSIVFVAIGRNEGERLASCIRSVLELSPRLVYADSGSTDGSVERARGLGVQVVQLDSSRPMNASRGRSEGLAAARLRYPAATYVQFLDGDCVLQPGWIESALDFIDRHPKAAAVCGRRFERDPAASFYNRLADEEWNTAVGKAEACGGDALMRIAALNEVGGFNPLLMASEEPELCGRLRAANWEIWRLDVPMTEHDAAIFRFGQWWRRTVRAGYGYAQAWRASRNLPNPVNESLLQSAFLWALVLPVIALAATLAFGRIELLGVLLAVYGLQITRIWAKRSDRSMYGWKASAILMLAKFAEAYGALTFLIGRRPRQIADYKAAA